MQESWVDEQKRINWRFRWGFRWELAKGRLWYWLWCWPTDGLVWDFAFTDTDGNPDPRLMHSRTKRHLATDDPRHFEDEEAD